MHVNSQAGLFTALWPDSAACACLPVPCAVLHHIQAELSASVSKVGERAETSCAV